jgi:hypothetical protein
MTSRRVALAMLAGGRSPTLHRHELRRAAARLNFSRRASAWIKELVDTHPTLSTDLHYGQCLPELAAALRAPGDSRNEVRPGFHGIGERRHEGRLVTEKPRYSQCPPELAASFRPAAASRDDARRSLRPLPSRAGEAGRITGWNDVYQGPLRAEAKLLRRLSGEPASSQTESAPRQQRSFSPDDSPNQELPSFPRSAPFEKKWLGDIAERAAAVLRNNSSDPLALPSLGRVAARGASERQAGSSTPWENSESRVPTAESSSLADQWSINLHGQTAPADLLARLTSIGFQGGEEVHRTGSLAQPDSAGEEAALESPVSPQLGDLAGTPAAPGFRADAAREEGKGQFTELARLHQRTSGFPDSVMAGVESIPLVPSLPAMLVTESTRHPKPNVAAAIVRQGVRTDEIHRQERPEELAERIRHILQEEARRHGIDV